MQVKTAELSDASGPGAILPPWTTGATEWTSSSAGSIAAGAVSAEELQLLQQSFERYEILDCIDRGGQGVVYRARQKGSARMVALKLLLDGPLAGDRQRYRFEREIELIARLRHANIVTLFDSGVARGRLYYAMEFIDGLPIDDFSILHDLSPRSIVELMVPVCRAIHFAHQNGVIHRDLKPAHILVGADGQPRVFDFGLAKDLGDSATDGRFSCTGLVVGTLPYLSPEQAGGLDGKSDVRSDVYALGVILFELLAELFPYPVDGPADEVRRAIATTEPLALRKTMALSGPDRAMRVHEVNADLEAIVGRTLRKEKAERYQSAAELADDLERFLRGEAVSARSGSRWYAARKFARKHRVATIVGASLAATMIAVSAAWIETRAQRDLARGAAQTAVDSWLIAVEKVEARLGKLPGGQEARKELIDELLAELPRLESFTRSDLRMSSTIMKLLARKGDIECSIGARDQAAQSYRELLERAEREVATSKSAEAHCLKIIGARGLAMTTDDTESHFRCAVELGREALERFPSDADVRFECCETLIEFASHLKRCREELRGLETSSLAVALIPEGEFAIDEGGRWARLEARAIALRGAMRLVTGSGADGLRDLHSAMEKRERIAESHPADTSARHELLRACYRTAIAEHDRGNTSRAEELLERAAAIGWKLADLDPATTKWDSDRFSIHHYLALLQLRRHAVEKAQASCGVASAIANRAESLNPEADDTRANLAFAAVLKGRIDLDKKDFDSALICFERAAGIREKLLESRPEVPINRRELAATYYWLGAANSGLGRLAAARPHYERSLLMFSQLAEGDFDVEHELNRIRAQTSLAALLMRHDEAESDASAGLLLTTAYRRIKQLTSDERLIGFEGRVQDIEDAIRQNRAILDRRELAERSK